MRPSTGPFVAVLKSVVRPHTYRVWNPDRQAWLFHWHWIYTVVRRARQYFDEVDYSALPLAWQLRAAGAQGSAQLALDAPQSDPFQALFVTENAPWEVVRAAYRALVAIYHPDVQKTGNREAFERVDRAYRQLAALRQSAACG